MNYQERLNKVTTEAAQDWVNKCNTLLNDYDKYFTSYHGKDDKEIERLRSRGSYLASQSNNFRRIYEGNSEALSLVDEIVKKLNGAEVDSKRRAEIKKFKAQTTAQQRAPLPNFSAIKKEVDSTSTNTPSADALKKADTRKALFQMSGKQDINSFLNITSGFFTDYDKKAENIALEQKNKLMQDKAAAQGTAYRNALNEERAKVGLPSFSQETMDSINKTMTDNMLSSTDNGYTRTQKLNNVKYSGLFYGALSSSDFQSVSESGAKKSAYNLSGDGLQEMHSVINGQQAPNSANRKYTQLNDSERQVWNYYIGKEATDEAIEFIKALEPALESRLAEKVSEEYDEQGIWGDVKELGVSAGGGLQKGVYDIARSVHGTGEALGHHIPNEMSYALFSPTYSEKLTNAVLADKNGDDGWFFNILCTALNSSTYQIPAMAISAMGGGMAGYVLQGIGSTTTEAIRNNTESVADVVYGAFQGAMEWAVDKALGGISSQLAGGGTSKLGTFLLNKIDDVIASPGVKKALSKLAIVGSSIVSENLEELIQMVADPFARAVIYGKELDVSEITLENVVETVIITTLSTLMMSPLTTNSSYKQYQAEKIGSGIIEMGGVESLVKFAEDFDANDTDLYDRVRTAFENKTEPDPMDVVGLYSAAMENYSKFSMDDAKKIAYNIADGGNVEGVARALFGGNTEAATKFIERFSGKQENTNSVKKTKVKRNQNNEYVPQFAENMEDDSYIDNGNIGNIVDNNNIIPNQNIFPSKSNGDIVRNSGFNKGIGNIESSTVDNIIQNGYNNVGNGIVNGVNTNQGNISEEQRELYTAAILRYKSSESYKINAKLRDNELLSETEQEFVDTLDAALQSLPTYEGTVYRNLVFDDSGGVEVYNDFVKQHVVGKPIFYNQFVSCSKTEDGYTVDGEYKVQLIVEGKQARDVDGYGNNMENEVIFTRDSVFIVTRVDVVGQNATIYLKEDVDDGYYTVEEPRTTVRDVQKSHIGNGNLQSVSKEDSNRYSRGAFRPQSTASGGQRNTVRTGGQRGTVLSTESGEQKVNTTNGEADFSESAFSMDENGASQSGTKGITEPDISKDTRSHEEQVVEKMNGKENAREKDRREVKRFGKKIGWEVRFDDIYARDKQGNIVYMTDKDGNRVPKRAEAKVNKASKTITIDYQNKNPIKTLLKHELTHFLETNLETYTTFANKVLESEAFKNWLNSKEFADVAAYRKDIISRYSSTSGFETSDRAEHSANLEMVAEFVGDNLFGDEGRMVQGIVEQIEPEQRSKFAELVNNLFEKLKEFFKGKKQQTEIETLEQEWIKAYKAAEQTWQQQKNTTENSGEQYAIAKDAVFKKYCDSIEKIAISDDISNKGQYIEVSQQTPKIIIERANAKNLPMVMQFDTAYLETRRDGKLKGNYHDLGVQNMKQLPKLLETPEYIVRLPNGRLNIIVDMSTIKGKQALVSIELEQAKQVNGKFNKYNLILTAFGAKEGYLSAIVDNQQNEVLYNRKTESQGTNQLYKGLAGINDSVSNNNIPHGNNVVNSNSMQNDEKYAIATASEEELLESYEQGEITREEYITEIKRKRAENPIEIAKMKKEEASITPHLKRRAGENVGDKESKFYDSALKSKIITDEVKAEIENDTFIKNYAGTTNKRTLKLAVEELETHGEAAVLDWSGRKPEQCSPVDVGIGLILLENYQRAGDTEAAVAVAEKLREIGTVSGQTVQMFSILGRFTPEMMQIYAQRELNGAFEKMAKKKTKRWIDNNKSKFELTDEDIEFIRRRTLQAALMEDGTRQKAVLLGEICARLQNKLPSEIGDSIRAYQRICLLLNPKTLIRNVGGNANMLGVFVASDLFGNLIDKQISKKTEVRTVGRMRLQDVKKNAEAFKKGLYESYDDFKKGISTKQEELDRFENSVSKGKNFNEQHNKKLAKQLNAIAKKLNELDNFTSFCLEAGDRSFFEMWFTNSLNNQLRLNNVEVPTEAMLDIAREEALQRTWQDNNTVTRSVGSIKKKMNALHIPGTSYGFGDFTIKFAKTPANIAKAMVEFSPIGLATAAFKAVDFKNALEKGDFTPQMQHEVVRSMSNAITGTLIYAFVAVLASLGAIKLSGAGDEDKDVSSFEKYIVGVPPYSIELFGQNVTYSWNQPMGTILAAIADIMENNKNGIEAPWYSDLWSAFKTGATVFTEQSFLTSLYEFFSAEDLATGFFESALAEPTAFVPQVVSQLASFTDEYRRVTYDSNDAIQSAINSVMLKIPGLRQMLPKQVNVLGELSENTQYLNPWDAFFNPANKYPESSGKVAEELYELYKLTGNKNVLPKTAPNYISVKGIRVNFTPQEKQDFQTDMGQLSVELIGAMSNSEEFKTLDEEKKIAAIDKVYEYAFAKAKCEIEYDYSLVSAMVGVKENGQPILTEEKYNRLSDNQRKILIEEYFLSNAETKCKGDTDKLIKLFIEKVKK